ncbi:TolA-binding protein [Terrimicrobium sacchariphilum]|uniref:TolA-binding protein n=1 Tax=Terrimicrobium sacchariphilum TaxID=690879 RepID=A0A146G8A2_TERSA|nr:tetratricopeptide repeat protein [Terrimicrobium sacchariphilum]GAT33939.1 TolA-binding protein [Terrimicrobium sacchariphilum]
MTKACWILSLFVSALLGGLRADDQLADVRKALADGLPDVALYRLGASSVAAPSPEALLLRARALNALGRYDEAVQTLQGEQNLTDEATLVLARAQGKTGRLDEALALYQKLSADPQFATEANLSQAAILEKLNQPAKAAQLLDNLAKNGPLAPELALKLAEIRLGDGNPQAAADLLNSSTGLAGDQLAAQQYLLAKVNLAQGKTAEAEKLLSAIKSPSSQIAADVVTLRADALVRQKDLSEAERVLEDFIEKSPNSAVLDGPFLLLDRVYASQGAASGAELKRWAADTTAPLRAQLALFFLAKSEARNSKIQRSRELFSQFLQSAPPGSQLANEASIALAQSYQAEGLYPQAMAALQGTPETGRTGFMRGVILAADGDYRNAAICFQQASGDPSLKQSALINACISATLAGIPRSENKAWQELASLPDAQAILRGVELNEGLLLAAQKRPEAGPLLERLAVGDSSEAQRARLALAEWQYAQLNVKQARETLKPLLVSNSPEREQSEYLAIFLEDTGDASSEQESLRLAEAFLKAYPSSQYEPDVRMKIGELYFRRGDYLGAIAQFDTVAEEFPASPLADKAVFLEAQAMARSMDPRLMEEAIDTYEKVASGSGALALRARLAQAVLYDALQRPKEALGILDKILASKPSADLRSRVLVEKGDIQFAQGATAPDQYKQAIATWDQVAADPSAPRQWSNQALAKMGAAYEKLGDNQAALNCYYRVFSQDQKGEPEYFWYYKAGFDAGRLLESQKLWKEAIAVYEKIAALEGPRAEEARNRVNKLRLENFLWEN